MSPARDDEATERDLDAYKQLVGLWAQENPIKTTKLQVLLAVNGGLFSIVPFQGFTRANWILYLAGFLVSAVWTLSIGRTVLYQKVWQVKLAEIATRHPDDARFRVVDDADALPRVPRWLRVLGGVSSKYYLLGAPIVFAVGWLVVLGVVFAR
jgi:hypothetical protein